MATGFLFLFWTSDSSWTTIWGSLRFLSFTLAKGAVRQLRNARGNPPGLGVGGQPAVIMAGRCGEGGAGSGLPNFHSESFTSTLAVDAGWLRRVWLVGLVSMPERFLSSGNAGTVVRYGVMSKPGFL